MMRSRSTRQRLLRRRPALHHRAVEAARLAALPSEVERLIRRSKTCATASSVVSASKESAEVSILAVSRRLAYAAVEKSSISFAANRIDAMMGHGNSGGRV